MPRAAPNAIRYFFADYGSHVIGGRVSKADEVRVSETIEGVGESGGEPLRKWTMGTREDLKDHPIVRKLMQINEASLYDILDAVDERYPKQAEFPV